MAGDGRSVRRKGVAALGVIAALIAALVLTLGLLGRGGSGAQASGEIYLTPAGSTAPDPFTASLMTPGVAPAPPPTPQASEPPPPVANQQAPAPAAGSDHPRAAPETGVSAPTPAAALTSVDASVPQLYGGHMGEAPCDSRILVRTLDGDADLARAWAEAAGVGVDGLHDFVGGLVGVDVLDDVRVTDWRHEDGHGVPYQVVLERGTAVLVDRHGEPRIRCISGDPLGLPAKVQTTARFVGDRWEHFEPAALVVIAPASKELPTLVLLEVTTGRPFGRPVRGGGDAGRDDIDTDTLVADQARLGVVVSTAPPARPDEVQDVRLIPAGGPPGSVVVAVGTGWPAGDDVRIEPCAGGRPETCALRPDLAVVVAVQPDASDGGFRATLRSPRDARPSDYVEFYFQDLRGDRHDRVFDAPWRVAAAECHDSCGDDPGCHPPFCGGGDSHDQHGCRCMVRPEPVCGVDTCGQRCPKDRCVDTLAVTPTPAPTARPTSQGGALTRNSQTTSHPAGQTQSGQSTQGAQTTHTQTGTQTTRSAQLTTAQSTRSQTTTSPSPPAATPKPTATPKSTAPPTATPKPTAPPPPPPTRAPQPTAQSTATPKPTAQPTATPRPTAQPTPRPQSTSPAPGSPRPGPSGR